MCSSGAQVWIRVEKNKAIKNNLSFLHSTKILSSLETTKFEIFFAVLFKC